MLRALSRLPFSLPVSIMSKTAARTITTLPAINITFLGTASAQPSSTRNHSSLALSIASDLWLFDCGEATQHQLQRSSLRSGKIKKVFITHTHGDHIFGLIGLLATRLNGAGGTMPGTEDPRANLDLAAATEAFEIYGPLGTRGYVRAGLTYTHTLLSGAYVVHELRLATDPAPSEDACPLPLHPCELGTGRNLTQAPDGTWRNIYEEELITVSAAPILHSAPCVGYVIQEQPLPGKVDPKVYAPAIKKSGDHPSIMRQIQQGKTVTLSDGTVLSGPPKRPGRKIAVLGDTYDPSPIADLARNVDLLIHEATNAHLPGLDPETKIEDTFASIEERTKSRGHSTPQMAGAFARRVGAKRLVLNHFSARYRGDKEAIEAANADDLSIHLFDPDKSSQQVAKEEASASRESSVPPIAAEETTPEDPHELRLRKAAGVMRGIRALAVKAYGSTDVLCAHDFMSVTVEIVK